MTQSKLPMWHLCAVYGCLRFVPNPGQECGQVHELSVAAAEFVRSRRPWMRGSVRALAAIWMGRQLAQAYRDAHCTGAAS
jgi:hypothetical protein